MPAYFYGKVFHCKGIKFRFQQEFSHGYVFEEVKKSPILLNPRLANVLAVLSMMGQCKYTSQQYPAAQTVKNDSKIIRLTRSIRTQQGQKPTLFDSEKTASGRCSIKIILGWGIRLGVPVLFSPKVNIFTVEKNGWYVHETRSCF